MEYLETGIRNIRTLAQTHTTAEIYFHIDLDGVTSAIGIKHYLKNKYGIETVGVHKIQYGGREYAVPKPKTKTLHILVDFAHGKPVMHIHTDHHEKQSGYTKQQSVAFSKTPSNAAYISQTLSPTDIFPPRDVDFISMVDSAGYAKAGYNPEDIIVAIFNIDKEKDIIKNKDNLGFVVNKLVLAFKNTPDFLERLVMESNPSLISMYTTIKKIMRDMGLDDPRSIQKRSVEYQAAQKGKVKIGKDPRDVLKMKSGDQLRFNKLVVQYGGGKMKKGSYDRYTVFKNNPDVHYFCVGWSMGLVQISKNPFMRGENPINFGDFAKNVILPKYESMMKRKIINIDYVKYIYERDIKKDIANDIAKIFNADQIEPNAATVLDSKGYSNKIMNDKGNFSKYTMENNLSFKELKDVYNIVSGKAYDKEPMEYSFNDLISVFDDKFNLTPKQERKMIQVMDKKSEDLNDWERNFLKSKRISLWDIVTKSSGGHRDITNIAALNFYGKKYVDVLVKPIMMDITKEMMNKQLKLGEASQIEENFFNEYLNSKIYM